MPYDPQWPQNGQVADADKFRDQFGSLKNLIDAIVGGITAAQVDGVTTVNPGVPAAVTVSVGGTTLHFTFAIPRGNDGAQGGAGATGPQGPPFAQAIVDAVNTLPPGTDATVSVSFDGTNVHFTYGIPRGADGIQGPPGEVTAAQLAAAIIGTSSNTNAVSTMDTPFTNDPPTLADIELMRTKYNELVLAARR